MTEVVSARFKRGGKAYYFNPNGMELKAGDEVIIETARGQELGVCVKGNFLIDERELFSPLRPILRRADRQDTSRTEAMKEKETEAGKIFQEKVREHGLEMKLVQTEYQMDGSKLLFYFTADGRVDFRSLVRDLGSIFHTRIELRQIGIRDEAKLLGGIGACGRPYCCKSFLNDFHSVSIKMAKTQGLALSPSKVSGACGRLMCCLKYEQESYEDALTRVPKLDSLVETPDGVGVVNQVQLLREQVKVRLDKSPEAPAYYRCSDITVIRSGKGKRPPGYELPQKGEEENLHPRQQLRQKPDPAELQEAQPSQKKKPPQKNNTVAHKTSAPTSAEQNQSQEYSRKKKRLHSGGKKPGKKPTDDV